jgi:lipopolysaccharide export system protein LptA
MMMFAAFIALAGRHRMLAAAAASLMLLSSQATPQPNSGTSKGGQQNALQGFSQNRNQPVQIEAASLEVRDKDKIATFSGSVKVVQGDTVMRCKSLVVYYEQQGQQSGGQAMKAATPGPGGSSSISKLEALGGVTVNQKDQTATGDRALFDMKANTVTLSGNVVVSQGQNVMRGDRLVVDLTSGVSRVESGKGPVKVLIQQGGSGDGKPGGGSGGFGGLGGLGGLGQKPGASGGTTR